MYLNKFPDPFFCWCQTLVSGTFRRICESQRIALWLNWSIIFQIFRQNRWQTADDPATRYHDGKFAKANTAFKFGLKTFPKFPLLILQKTELPSLIYDVALNDTHPPLLSRSFHFVNAHSHSQVRWLEHHWREKASWDYVRCQSPQWVPWWLLNSSSPYCQGDGCEAVLPKNRRSAEAVLSYCCSFKIWHSKCYLTPCQLSLIGISWARSFRRPFQATITSIITGPSSDKCRFCSGEQEEFFHEACECPALTEERRKVFHKLPISGNPSGLSGLIRSIDPCWWGHEPNGDRMKCLCENVWGREKNPSRSYSAAPSSVPPETRSQKDKRARLKTFLKGIEWFLSSQIWQDSLWISTLSLAIYEK